MHDFIYEVLLSSKYASVFGLMLLLPSEAVMPATGFAAAQGKLSLATALTAGVAGTVAGSVLIYVVCRLMRDAVVDTLVLKYGRPVGLTPKSVNKASRLFDRHAKTAVFVSRFVPGLRSAVCMSAGLGRMPFATFMTYLTLGSIVDSVLLAYLGYTAGSHYEELEMVMANIIAWSLPAMLFGAGLGLIWYELRKTSKHR